MKLEAQGAEIKSERFFSLPFLPHCAEGKWAAVFRLWVSCAALCWIWGEDGRGASVLRILDLPRTWEGLAGCAEAVTLRPAFGG